MADRLYIGGSKAKKMYLGTQEVKAMYLGATQVYPYASVIAITGITTSTVVPAGGGTVTLNLTIAYTIDGTAKTVAHSLSRRYNSLGENVTTAKTKVDTITLYLNEDETVSTASGVASGSVDIYQAINSFVSASWGTASAGSISGASFGITDTSKTVSNASAASASRSVTLTYTSGSYDHTASLVAYAWACSNTSFSCTSSNATSLTFTTTSNAKNTSTKSAQAIRAAVYAYKGHSDTIRCTATLTQEADYTYDSNRVVGGGYEYSKDFTLAYGNLIGADGSATSPTSLVKTYRYRYVTKYVTDKKWASGDISTYGTSIWEDNPSWSSNQTATVSFSISEKSNGATINSITGSVSASPLGTTPANEVSRGLVTCTYTMYNNATATETAYVKQQQNKIEDTEYAVGTTYYVDSVDLTGSVYAGGGTYTVGASAYHVYTYYKKYTSGSPTGNYTLTTNDSYTWEILDSSGTWTKGSGNYLSHGSMETKTTDDWVKVRVYNASDTSKYADKTSGNISNGIDESKNVSVTEYTSATSNTSTTLPSSAATIYITFQKNEKTKYTWKSGAETYSDATVTDVSDSNLASVEATNATVTYVSGSGYKVRVQPTLTPRTITVTAKWNGNTLSTYKYEQWASSQN